MASISTICDDLWDMKNMHKAIGMSEIVFCKGAFVDHSY